ncbi:MAG: hypothetical protein HY862_15530 [Chloroflexi bacterium]|nr:hypothetical protein [Chloroflexota bacterium]
MKKLAFWFWMLMAAGMLAACNNNNNPTPDADGPILVSANDMPKVLVTVQFTATSPVADQLPTATIDLSYPTDTPEPPEPTSTPTPYVGVYVGPQSSGTPLAGNVNPILPGNLPGATVPVFLGAPTAQTIPIGPVLVTPTLAVAGPVNCSVQPAASFYNAYGRDPNLQQKLGCPRDGGYQLTLVYEQFERGIMFWRESKEIYALQSTDHRYFHVVDTWADGQPESDPAFAPPAENLRQPIRGFGLAWRSNESLRNSIGWASQGEVPYSSYWQDFERGFMIVGGDGQVYAFVPVDANGGSFDGPLAP